jgi:spore coat protein U-like protein
MRGYDEDLGTQSIVGYADTAGVFGLQVQCNDGTPWSLAPDNGQNFGMATAFPTNRALTDGAGHYIAYEMWTDDAMTTVWSAGSPIAGTGNGLWQDAAPKVSFPAAEQSFIVTSGVYQDTVSVTLTYN